MAPWIQSAAVPLLASGAPSLVARLGAAISDVVSGVATLWDSTTSPEYLDSSFSRRQLRLMLPAWYLMWITFDLGLKPSERTPAMCVDGVPWVFSLSAALIFRRSSYWYDAAVFTGISLSFLKVAYDVQFETHTNNAEVVSEIDMLTWMLQYLNHLAFILTGTHFLVCAASLVLWSVVVNVVLPSASTLAFTCLAAAGMLGFNIGVDLLCTGAFASNSANKALLQHSSNGFIAIDTLSGHIRKASDNAVSLFVGVDIVGQRAISFACDADNQERLSRLIKAGGEPVEFVQWRNSVA